MKPNYQASHGGGHRRPRSVGPFRRLQLELLEPRDLLSAASLLTADTPQAPPSTPLATEVPAADRQPPKWRHDTSSAPRGDTGAADTASTALESGNPTEHCSGTLVRAAADQVFADEDFDFFAGAWQGTPREVT